MYLFILLLFFFLFLFFFVVKMSQNSSYSSCSEIMTSSQFLNLLSQLSDSDVVFTDYNFFYSEPHMSQSPTDEELRQFVDEIDLPEHVLRELEKPFEG